MTLSAFLDFAHELADAAATATLPHFRTRIAIEDKTVGASPTDFDPVTKADRNAEKAIRALIEARHPTHAILGEEFGEKAGKDLQWVLDPIDGTRSFISGMPLWGTLIALTDISGAGARKNAHVRLGLMDQPFIGERYFATRGDGAWIRHGGTRTQLHTRPCPTLENAAIATTSPLLFDAKAAAKWQDIAARAKLVRYGGDCYCYAQLAAGHIDAVIEPDLQPYDIQALIVLIEEAGGIITNWDGSDAAEGGSVIACGDPQLHTILRDLLS